MTKNRLLSAGLEIVLRHAENASCYRQFSTNIKIKIMKLIPVLLAWAFCTSVLRKLAQILLYLFVLISAEIYL